MSGFPKDIEGTLILPPDTEVGANFWSMSVGNYWVYDGSDKEGGSWTSRSEVKGPDTATIPGVTTYEVEGYRNGIYRGSTWYSISLNEIKDWKEVLWDETYGQIILLPNDGLPVMKNPILVGGRSSATTTGTVYFSVLSFPVNISLDITVQSQEFVIVPLGAYKAYKSRHIIRFWNDDYGINETTTQYTWFVPYLGVIKWQSGDGYETEVLSSMNIKKGIVDFDSDAKTEVAVYDVANGWWFIHHSKDGSYVFDAIGVGGGPQWKPVPGDYGGDGKTDVSVYDAQYGWWLFHYSSGSYFYDHIGVGGTGYTAVPGDYNGDGITDIAVYGEANADWFIKYSSGGYAYDSLGGTGWVPFPADYDGDGKIDVAVYNVAEGWWYLHHSRDGSYVFDAIGVGGGSQWKPVPGDYDGDGKADVAVYDAQDGWWLFHYTAGGYFYDHIGVGGTGHGAVPGDYDGDGVTDIAVYEETNGYWYTKYSSGGYGFDSLGGSGNVPVR
jgi:hypothetical protein